MANTNRPNGFRPIGANGGPFTGVQRKVFSTANNLFVGDLVKQAADPVLSGDGVYQEVDRVAGAADLIAGVVVGFQPNPTALGNLYHASSSTYAVYIVDVEGVDFEVQGDGVMDQSDVGLNADHVWVAGTTATGLSNMEIDATSAATTAGLSFRIIGMADRADNDTADATDSITLRVRCNQSAWADQIAGV